MNFDRRNLLKAATGSSLLLALGMVPRLARAQAANRNIFVLVFLRGGADGMSFVHPAPGTAPRRRKYEEWRLAGTRVRDGIPIGGGFAMHPALAPLQPLLGRDELSFVPALGGAQFNRSHFEQQDLVESGASTSGPPRGDGFLGRALELLPQSTEAISSIALSELSPYSLRFSGRSPLSIPDFNTFGALSSRTYRPNANRPLRERLDALYVGNASTCGGICEVGSAAIAGLDDISRLRDQITPFPTDRFAALASMVRADVDGAFKFITLDFGGWDTHNGQGNDAMSGGNFSGGLAQRIGGLAGSLRGLYDAAKAEGVWDRFTVAVISEFGRTTRENGTQGTDHGYGGIGMILGSGLRAPMATPGYFPAGASEAFYSQAEGNNVVPRLVEHREVLGQILRDRLGLSAPQVTSTVFPGFTFSDRPRLFV